MLLLHISVCLCRFIVDMKCSATTVCWYCQDLCTKCLKPATQTFNTLYKQVTYNFCSMDCKDSCFVKEGSLELDDSCSTITELRGHIHKHNELSISANIRISLDKNGNLLISHYARSFKHQLYFQVLCSKNFDILNPVLSNDWLASRDDLKDKQIRMLHNMAESLKTSGILKIVYQKLLETNNDLVQKESC